MIHSLLESQFDEAVNNPENINEDGSINWNFVDADVYMDVGPKNNQSNVLHYKMFDFLADAFEKANGKQIQGKEATLGVFSEYAEEGLQ